MATTPKKTTTRKPAAKKATAKKAAAPKATVVKKTAARKPAAPRQAAPRKSAPKSTVDTIRETVEERIVKPARAAAGTAYGAASTAAESAWDATSGARETARDAASNARETIAAAASQGTNFGLKMIEHAEQNAREAFNAMRAAAKSKDVSEVLKVQGEFLREQGARSLSQAREVGDLIAQFGRDAIAPLTGKKK